MIARMWRGWTSRDNAAAYAKLLRTRIFPGIDRVAGFRGGYLLRRDGEDGVEFVTLTLFDSMDAVKAFAGDDYEVAVVLPEAEVLLTRFEPRSTHYDVVVEP